MQSVTLCIKGPKALPKILKRLNVTGSYTTYQGLLSLYIHTHKRFDYGFKYFKLMSLISTNTSQYIGSG